MFQKIIVPSPTQTNAVRDLRHTLLELLQFRLPDETGIIRAEQGDGLSGAIAMVTIRRREERAFYANRYRFYTDGTAARTPHGSSRTDPIVGGWRAAILLIVREALAAYRDYLNQLVGNMTTLEHHEHTLALDPTQS